MADFLSDDWLEEMNAAAATRPRDTAGDGSRLVIQQVVTGAPAGDREYIIAIDGDELRFQPGRAESYDVRLAEDYETAAALAQGKITAADAFLRGRIRIGGDLAAAAAGADVLAACGDVFAAVRDRTRF